MKYSGLALLLAIYLLICLAFYVKQDSLTFVPSRGEPLTPRAVGLPYDDVELHTEDGLRLHAWAVPPANPFGMWILHCHGNGGNMAGRLDVVQAWRAMGHGVLMFDYRGYGVSEGAPSEVGLYRDAHAAWDYLVKGRGVLPAHIVVQGVSLGGGVASELAATHNPAGLILQSTFTSVADVGASRYPWLPVRALCRNRFPSIERVGQITCPKLHLHSPTDDVVPYVMGRQLFETAGQPKTWIDLTGGHNAPLDELWRGAVSSFVRSLTHEARQGVQVP